MKYISLPDEATRRLTFYLATEEFVARHITEPECFFMWQVNPTVIFGRNQLIENEVNLDYCRQHGIETYRRKSGGGCVYADRSNIMFSYITNDINVRFTFDKYLRMVAFVLRKLGVEAEATGRNDILVHGKKVSGNAFYHLPGRSIVHGTMLFDTDMEQLVRAITPSNEKLVSKGVASVRQHVTNLSEYLTISIDDYKDFVRRQMCDGEIRLTSDDLGQIEEIEKEYLTEKFIYGNNPHYTIIKKGRTASAGELELRIELKNGIIKDLNLVGDYFLVGDLDHGLIARLRQVPYREDDVRRALADVCMEEIILNLTREEFTRLMFSEQTINKNYTYI